MSIEEIKQALKALAEPIVEQNGAFLVDCQIRNDRGGKLLQVFIDTDDGITIDHCAEVSRALSAALDTRPVVETSYHLEVSSPGIDRPLRLLRQYKKNVGRKFTVKYSAGSGSTTVSATLVSVMNDQLTFQPLEGESFRVAFEDIIESKEELPW